MSPNIEQIALKREIAILTPAEELTLISEIRSAYLASQTASTDPLNAKIMAEAAHTNSQDTRS